MKARSKSKSPDPAAEALLLHQLAAAARSRNLCCPLCAEVRKPVALADGRAALACPRCGDVAPDEAEFRAPLPARPPTA